MLLSIPIPQPNGKSRFSPAVGFEQRRSEATLQGVQTQLPIGDGGGAFAGEMA